MFRCGGGGGFAVDRTDGRGRGRWASGAGPGDGGGRARKDAQAAVVGRRRGDGLWSGSTIVFGLDFSLVAGWNGDVRSEGVLFVRVGVFKEGRVPAEGGCRRTVRRDGGRIRLGSGYDDQGGDCWTESDDSCRGASLDLVHELASA